MSSTCSLELLGVVAVVVAEHHHGGVPLLTGIEAVLEDLQPDTGVASVLGVDLDRPAVRNEAAAHLAAIPGGRRLEEGVAEHEQPVAIGELPHAQRGATVVEGCRDEGRLVLHRGRGRG